MNSFVCLFLLFLFVFLFVWVELFFFFVYLFVCLGFLLVLFCFDLTVIPAGTSQYLFCPFCVVNDSGDSSAS